MAPIPQTFIPRTNAPRPHLPIKEYNTKLMNESTPQPVKFQVINREGQDIVVGRIKVPTPTGHAFILRRFDTGAISLSTMFRASYPTATEDAEKAETAWVKNNFDTAGSNGGGRLRLAGTWVPPDLALHLSRDYNLLNIVPYLAKAAPEPSRMYRKSGKPGPGSSPTQHPVVTHEPSHTAVDGMIAPSLSIPSSLPPTTPKSTRPASKLTPKASSPARQPPPAKRLRKSASPAPSLIPKPTPTKVRSSPRRSAKVQEEEEEEPEVPAPDPDEDIAGAQEDVRRLKAEFAAHKAAKAKAGVEDDLIPITPAKKRGVQAMETPPLRFDMEKIDQAASEMDLVPLRPIVKLKRLEPQQKAAAWGGFALLLGVGISAAVPYILPGGSFSLW